MRRKEGAVTDRILIDWIIGQAQVCRLGLSKDSVPYVVPVNYGYDGTCVYFHTAIAGMKIEYILSNPRVCFEFEHAVNVEPDGSRACSWTTSFYCVIGWGTATEIADEVEKASAMNCIMHHYSDRDWSFDESALCRTRVWRISVDEITGKRSHKPESIL